MRSTYSRDESATGITSGCVPTRPSAEHAHDRAERVEIAVDAHALAADQDHARDVLVEIGQRRDEARVRRVAERERLERLVGRLERHDHVEPQVEHLGHEVEALAALERVVREHRVVPVAVLVTRQAVLELRAPCRRSCRGARARRSRGRAAAPRSAARRMRVSSSLPSSTRAGAELLARVVLEADAGVLAVLGEARAQRVGLGRDVDVGVVEIGWTSPRRRRRPA